MIRETEAKLKQQLDGMTCATHGKKPSIRLEQGASLDNLSIEVTACCDALLTDAQAALGAK